MLQQADEQKGAESEGATKELKIGIVEQAKTTKSREPNNRKYDWMDDPSEKTRPTSWANLMVEDKVCQSNRLDSRHRSWLVESIGWLTCGLDNQVNQLAN